MKHFPEFADLFPEFVDLFPEFAQPFPRVYFFLNLFPDFAYLFPEFVTSNSGNRGKHLQRKECQLPDFEQCEPGVLKSNPGNCFQ